MKWSGSMAAAAVYLVPCVATQAASCGWVLSLVPTGISKPATAGWLFYGIWHNTQMLSRQASHHDG